jgi:hypothetical protein
MVAMVEAAFLIACVVVGSWWLAHTNLYRAHRRSGVWTGPTHNYRAGSFLPNRKPVPPQHPGCQDGTS